jgi:transglutaminase-like putative cysteine protease
MRYKEPYKNIKHTMREFGRQVAYSVPYAANWMPMTDSPRHMFHVLKQNTTYKNDPPGVELLQRMESLFEDNYHGVSGAGDCDCFTIAAVACAVANDIPVRICIVGNSPKGPSHVYCEMKENGKWVAFDLVNAFYGETKPYKYKKIIAVKG